MSIEDRILSKNSRVLVIGGGYVGLPLAVECALAGFSTDVFDLDDKKITNINNGVSYIGDVPSQVLSDLKDKKLIRGVGLPIYSEIDVPDVILICVPTLLNEFGDPEPKYIIQAIRSLCQYTFRFDKEYLIILESTVYPGFTRDVLNYELESSKKYFGVCEKAETYVAFSPERIDPNNKTHGIKNTPKLIGGINDDSSRIANAFYSQVIDTTVVVSSSEVAEMTKIFENTYRMINLGYVNEMAILCHKMGIDIWEVINSASTKPFGFTKFTPGPGVGGACIPINPKYLKYKLRKLGLRSKVIEAAEEANFSMPKETVGFIYEALNKIGKSISCSKILIVGVSYKSNIDDVRESPSLYVIDELLDRGADVNYYDPYVKKILTKGGEIVGINDLNEDKDNIFDCAVVLTHHDCVNYDLIQSETLVDMRNIGKTDKINIIIRL